MSGETLDGYKFSMTARSTKVRALTVDEASPCAGVMGFDPTADTFWGWLVEVGSKWPDTAGMTPPPESRTDYTLSAPEGALSCPALTIPAENTSGQNGFGDLTAFLTPVAPEHTWLVLQFGKKTPNNPKGLPWGGMGASPASPGPQQTQVRMGLGGGGYDIATGAWHRS